MYHFHTLLDSRIVDSPKKYFFAKEYNLQIFVTNYIYFPMGYKHRQCIARDGKNRGQMFSFCDFLTI
jgi:hypothetical protein